MSSPVPLQRHTPYPGLLPEPPLLLSGPVPNHSHDRIACLLFLPAQTEVNSTLTADFNFRHEFIPAFKPQGTGTTRNPGKQI